MSLGSISFHSQTDFLQMGESWLQQLQAYVTILKAVNLLDLKMDQVEKT